MTATTRSSVARIPRKSPLRVVATPTVLAPPTAPRSRSRRDTAVRFAPAFSRITTWGSTPGSAASTRSGRTYATRPSSSSERTVPTTRKRASSPLSSWTARLAPGPVQLAFASPTQVSASSPARSRRPAASGGFSKRVWSPSNAKSLTGSPAANQSGPPTAHTPPPPARPGVGDARDAPHVGHRLGRQRRGELVALADRARVVAQRRDERGEAEHEQDDRAADGEDRERRGGPAAAGEGEPGAQHAEPARGDADAPRLRAGELGAAQQRDRRPRRRAPRRPAR